MDHLKLFPFGVLVEIPVFFCSTPDVGIPERCGTLMDFSPSRHGILMFIYLDVHLQNSVFMDL